MLPPRPRAPDKPRDYTDPSANKEADAAASLRVDRLRGVERTLLATPEGREWLWQLLQGFGVFAEGEMLPFDQGQRESGLRLMRSLLRSSPRDAALMFSEHDPL